MTLHSKDLKILESDVSIKELNGAGANETTAAQIPISSHQYVKESDFYTVSTNQKLLAGRKYLLSIPFRGELNEGLAGYYRSSYLERASNKTK